MLEWIVWVYYVCKYDQYPWPKFKLVLKNKNMINEDRRGNWTNEKWDFLNEGIFLLDPPYEKDQKVEDVKHLILMNV